MNYFIGILRHWFLPHEQNHFKARALHLDALSGYLVVMIALVIGVKVFSVSNVLGFATDITVDRLYQLTNEQRLSHGLSALSYNQTLAEAAKAKAQNMFAHNYWAHFGPNGETPWQFMQSVGYTYQYAGENLAKNFLISQGVIDAWMNSKTHRENILRPEYQEVGFAIVNGVINGEQTTLVIQMLGTPLENSIDKNSQKLQQLVVTQAPEQKPVQNTVVESVEGVQSRPFITLPVINSVQFLLIGFLVIALFLDFIVAAKLSIVQMGGKHIAHIIFVIIIAVSCAVILKGGAI